MILSEKITELRKKSGLSQEALGEKLGVSRQAVSKWELAQAVPELNKVIEMAKVFGVSTDLLLKDELELPAQPPAVSAGPEKQEAPARTVTLSEANSYLAQVKRSAGLFAAGNILFWVSPFTAIILLGFTEDEKIVMIGAVVEVLFLIAAAAAVVPGVHGLSAYRYLKKEPFEPEYGVTGAVSARMQEFERTRPAGLVAGISLCLGSVIPLMVSSVLSDSDVASAACGCVMLLMIACGTAVLIRNAVIRCGFKRLLTKQDPHL